MSLLSAHRLEKHYGQHVVLENLNFSVEEGEFVTLVGASGCGKTTFLKMLLGTRSAPKAACCWMASPFLTNQALTEASCFKSTRSSPT